LPLPLTTLVRRPKPLPGYENATLGGAAQSNFGGTGNSARRVAKPVVAQTRGSLGQLPSSLKAANGQHAPLSVNDGPRHMADEEEEDLRTLLQRRERQAINRREYIRAKGEELDEELAEIWTAMRALGLPTMEEPSISTFSGTNESESGLGSILEPYRGGNALSGLLGSSIPPSPLTTNPLTSLTLSIKEMVLGLLRGNKRFRLYGATATQIRDAIKDTFDRDVARESLSPTLSRMRDEGLIEQAPGGHWTLAEPGNPFVKGL
jgi:hypothetical protein